MSTRSSCHPSKGNTTPTGNHKTKKAIEIRTKDIVNNCLINQIRYFSNRREKLKKKQKQKTKTKTKERVKNFDQILLTVNLIAR